MRAVQVVGHAEQVGLAPGDRKRLRQIIAALTSVSEAFPPPSAAIRDVVVLDGPTSALDVTVQAGIVDLLFRLQAELGLTYLFVSHDLSLVRQLADTMSVLEHGRVVEEGPAQEIFSRPGPPIPGRCSTRSRRCQGNFSRPAGSCRSVRRSRWTDLITMTPAMAMQAAPTA
jgi:ABC-type antimicrobial peptide transport system ATPase subunit